ncbi:hypothetical protein HELRODRAFT_168393 [Helobdella robusta]|uniref:PSI domain-containing protein n=1 Tax=Helobdella robusta TaxID=6412 RepID=T1F0J4_HELRO|nr:hypothetical protein HELRODRAFT_168393 [Helobdella robusta]ESO09410.1 hypothetical protein HELRODRAFT_168393 [Helobdella robusta]
MVYNCSTLASSCAQCQTLDPKYDCVWCSADTDHDCTSGNEPHNFDNSVITTITQGLSQMSCGVCRSSKECPKVQISKRGVCPRPAIYKLDSNSEHEGMKCKLSVHHGILDIDMALCSMEFAAVCAPLMISCPSPCLASVLMFAL